ncbi:unnamed protein product (macronuclear) [Paramecium tetraurelia]|uniref:Uncharacterized protein n=1 Tax=Paramecium tetraurelia TaxID=5888 RepID=A0CEB6_PARTE|nr:uncharacterized protein GSPATT00037569001 [Paramecium tetraurelia]CAK69133.1 unnamed protein product [Paramecium tetraurelia]|eukprot:XP_001436530.1 hypothetical protein (macronuclear) [Paramecium tetraurelia strain d4-2]
MQSLEKNDENTIKNRKTTTTQGYYEDIRSSETVKDKFGWIKIRMNLDLYIE